jgi:Zn-dependent protease
MGATAALGLFTSIVLHELGHALMARRLGLRIRSITLFIFGGLAEMEDEPRSARAEFLVAVAGPAVSLAIAGLALLAALVSFGPTAAVIRYILWANVLLIAFNAIPAFPLTAGACSAPHCGRDRERAPGHACARCWGRGSAC